MWFLLQSRADGDANGDDTNDEDDDAKDANKHAEVMRVDNVCLHF